MKRLTARILKQGTLTDKEIDILRLMCEGYYRPEIAQKKHRTISTISKHIESIAEKLDAHGSTEIVLIAEQLGLIEIKLSHSNHPLMLCIVLLLIASQLTAPLITTQMPAARITATRIRPQREN